MGIHWKTPLLAAREKERRDRESGGEDKDREIYAELDSKLELAYCIYSTIKSSSSTGMALSIQSLSFKTSKDRIIPSPVLRQGSGLKSLLVHYDPTPTTANSWEKERDGVLRVRNVSSFPCFHGHRLMRWRAFHFRDPDETYSYRARIEPQPPQLPAAEHKQNSSAVSVHVHLTNSLYPGRINM